MIQTEKEQVEVARNNIMSLIKKNDSEKDVYVDQFDKLHQEVLEEKK